MAKGDLGVTIMQLHCSVVVFFTRNSFRQILEIVHRLQHGQHISVASSILLSSPALRGLTRCDIQIVAVVAQCLPLLVSKVADHEIRPRNKTFGRITYAKSVEAPKKVRSVVSKIRWQGHFLGPKGIRYYSKRAEV